MTVEIKKYVQVDSTDPASPGGQVIADIEAAGAQQVQLVKDTGTDQVAQVSSVGDGKQQLIVQTADEKVTLVQDEGDTQVARVQAEGSLQESAVTAAGSAAEADVVAEGDTQVARVTTAGTTQTGLVNTAGATQLATVNAAGAANVANVVAAATANLYATEAAGRAAVADGAFFAVVGAGNVYASLYQRVNAGASTFIASIPSVAALAISTATIPDNLSDVTFDALERIYSQVRATDGGVEFGAVRAREVNGITEARLAEAARVALADANYRGPPNFPFDWNIYLQSGQSNSEGADSVPINLMSSTAIAGVFMVDAIIMRLFSGTRRQNGLTPAIEQQMTDPGSPGVYWGVTGARAAAQVVMDLTAAYNRSTPDMHGKIIIPMCVGRSSSPIANFGPGGSSGVWQEATLYLNYIKTLAAAAGKTVGIVGLGWAWGAQGYLDNLSIATIKGQYRGYKDNVDTLWGRDIFGQPVKSIRMGIQQSAAHGSRGYPTNAFVAEAERQFQAENPGDVDIVNYEGPTFGGTGGSFIHHVLPWQSVQFGGQLGVWLYKACIMREKWNSYQPVVSRSGTRFVYLDYGLEGQPPGFDLLPALTPTATNSIMQPAYGYFLYDVAAPTVELALARQPYTDPAVPGRIIFEAAADLPAAPNLMLRSSQRSPSGRCQNYRVKPFISEYAMTVPYDTGPLALERWPAIFQIAVP